MNSCMFHALFSPIVFQAQSQKLTNLRTWEKRKEKRKGRQTERDFMEETQCIWSTYPDWIPPGWESAVSVIHELYALCQVAPQSHPSPADKAGWAWQTVTNGLTPAPSLPAGPADNWVWHGKQSQPGPFSASKSCRQLGLTWKTVTTWPLLCQQVLQTAGSDMEKSQTDNSASESCIWSGLTWKTVTKWPLLCQEVLQTTGSDMENSHKLTPSLPASPACGQVWHGKCHKLNSSLPASSTDNWVWHGKLWQTDPFSARQSCLTWKTVTNWHLLCKQVLQTVMSDMEYSHTRTPSLPQSCLTWKMVTNWHLLCQ